MPQTVKFPAGCVRGKPKIFPFPGFRRRSPWPRSQAPGTELIYPCRLAAVSPVPRRICRSPTIRARVSLSGRPPPAPSPHQRSRSAEPEPRSCRHPAAPDESRWTVAATLQPPLGQSPARKTITKLFHRQARRFVGPAGFPVNHPDLGWHARHPVLDRVPHGFKRIATAEESPGRGKQDEGSKGLEVHSVWCRSVCARWTEGQS